MSKIKKITVNPNKKSHILTLDQRWYDLFAKNKTPKIASLEKQVNTLLREQGKLSTEHKDYQLLKKKVMDEIVANMNMAESNDAKAQRKMSLNKKYVDEINKKLEHHEKRLTVLPAEIEAINYELMNQSIATFYDQLNKHKTELETITTNIDKFTKELVVLKKKKVEHEEAYQKLYGFIHDMLGQSCIEEFDATYLGVKKRD